MKCLYFCLSRISSIAASMSAFSSPDLLSRCQSTFSSAPRAFDVAVECLVLESIIFHPFHVTEPCKSSFLDSVNYCFLLLQYIPDSFISHFLQSRDSQYFSETTHFCRPRSCFLLVSSGFSILIHREMLV